MNVTLRQLRLFLAVARLGGFSKAANAVGLSQSATSLSIHELEDALGVKLLDRTTRQVRLTAVGQSLQEVAGRLLLELDASLRDIRAIGAQKRGLVTVSVAPSVAARLMPAVLRQCAAQYEHLHLRVFDDPARDVRRKVGTGEAEFGVTSGPLDEKDLVCEPLFEDRFCLVTRRDHPLGRRRTARWLDLEGEQLVMLDNTSGSRRLIGDTIGQADVSVKVVLELAQPSSVSAMVEAGIGIAVMPRLACPAHSKSLQVIPLDKPAVSRSILLIRKADRSLSPFRPGGLERHQRAFRSQS